MPRSRLKTVLIVLKLTVSTALLIVLFRRADMPAMLARFRQMDPFWTMAALATYALMLGVSAWRWRLLLRIQTVDVGLGTLTKSFLVATFFNNFLPSNIGGDVVRVADTAPFTGSKTLATTVVLIDRILGLIALLVVAAAASVVAWRIGLRLQGIQYVWLALVIFTIGLLAFLKNPHRLTTTVRSVLSDRLTALQTRLHNLVAAISRFAQPRRLWHAFAGDTCADAAGPFTSRGRIARGPVPAAGRPVIVPISLAVQMVPVSINGFGVRSRVRVLHWAGLVSSALTPPLGSAALIMLFSPSGGAVLMRPRQARLGDTPNGRA